MGSPLHSLLLAFFFAFFASHRASRSLVLAQKSPASVDVGVVLDLGTETGKRSRTSISMAIDDFYALHGDHATRVVLHVRDSDKDAVGAAAAAVDLLKNVRVKAIIGPMTSTEAAFLIQLGDRTHVPVLSFSATNPALCPAHTPYFVRTTTNDSSQVAAIASVVQHFGWREAVLVYADTEYGTGIVPFLTDALQSVDARVPYRGVIPSEATDAQLDGVLRELKAAEARVFIVHMLPYLALRLFRRAKKLGMMSRGYVWIATDGVTSVLELLDRQDVLEAMQGLIGVRHYVNRSKEVTNFTARFRWRFRQDNPTVKPADPSVIQLWAYDTAWAVAMAVEKLHPARSAFKNSRSGNDSTDLSRLGVSQTGLALRNAIFDTRFRGLAGEFQLVDGQLQSSAFEIVNVDGEGETTVAFWTPENGISEHLNSTASAGLKSVVWPGDSTEVPKGWEIPTDGKRLRIAVPVKHGFDQFVRVETDAMTNRTSVTGFCIDVFQAVIDSLPYAVTFDYIPVANSSKSYDNFVYQVFLKNFDAVVGDTTIIANRSQFVDFTMPYTDSGVSMVVRVKDAKSKDLWIFLEPLPIDLWLGSLAFFVFTGLMVWVIERQENPEFAGKPLDQLGTIFYFAFSILVFTHKEKLTSNLTRFAVIMCTFVVLILTSSYTASLTSILTVQQLQPTVTDVNQLLSTGAYIGHQDGSYAVGLLKRMGFQDHKFKNYSTPDQYAEALSKGSANGGVDAVFDEIPYLKLFLSQHCADFTMVGPIYKTDGFGFVFPRGSQLVPDVSRAILNVTEGEKMAAIEKKWFGDRTNCTPQSNSLSSSSLAFWSFGGLFLITGAVSGLALLIGLAKFIYHEWDGLRTAASEKTSLWKKIVAVLKHYHDVDGPRPCLTLKMDDYGELDDEDLNKIARPGDAAGLHGSVGSQSPVSVSDRSDFSFASPEEGMSSTEPSSPYHYATVEMAEIREAA
ncbi:unnamed protein product [Musa acuminata subsp. malaccensis]|uniref:Glutamate receptor n=1 Tax=Musa acuminata subsp. malaccensis TaxID=214687 RepID=A0A804IK48_MUSAM|nr:PREDICTED: glutamate receptor 2.7 [Musa acuminata subsp. malaccensis]CAG1840956.1 unnamed protein product [Musa acuminata subsp. malaccensis]